MSPRFAFFLIVLISLSAGCSGPKRTDLVDAGRVKIERVDSLELDMAPPQVTESEGIVQFHGVVRRKSRFDGTPKGHIHLDLYENGEWTDQIAIGWQPREIPTDGDRSATYVIQYYWTAPRGSVVRVSIVDDEHFAPLSSARISGSSSGVGTSSKYGNATPQPGGAPRTGATRMPYQPGQPSQPKTPGMPTGRSGRR